MVSWLVDDAAATVTKLTAAGIEFAAIPSARGAEEVDSGIFSGPDGQLLQVAQIWPVSGTKPLITPSAL